MKETLSQAHKYKVWMENLQKHGNIVHGVEEIHVKHRYNGEVLFALVNLDATTPEGGKIPPICFLKGSAVSVLICFTEKETGNQFLLLVRQRRICDGSFMYEHAAGMVDKDDVPLAVAVREIQEETGLEVDEHQVIALHEGALYPSSGTCDEGMYLYYCELEKTQAEIAAFHLKDTGAQHENEQIQTCIVPVKEALPLLKNAVSVANFYLWLEKSGRMKW